MGRRDVLLLSFLTFITAIAWIVFDVYHASVTSTIPQEVETQLAPVTPKFDTEVIEKIRRRENIEPFGSENAIVPVKTTTSSATITPRPIGTEVGAQQTATQSGGP